MSLDYRIVAVGAVAATIAACGDGIDYDPTPQAIDGVRSELGLVDSSLLRAENFALFRSLELGIAEGSDRAPLVYDAGRWSWEIPGYSMAFEFADAQGTPQRDPGEDTDRMQLEVRQEVSRFYGVDKTSVGVLRSTTTGMQGYTISIEISHGQDIETQTSDVVARTRHRQYAQGRIMLVDRGPQSVPRFCPEGEVLGESMAWGEIDESETIWDPFSAPPADAPGSTSFDFEAHFEGRELVWRTFDGADTIDEGRLLTEFAEGC